MEKLINILRIIGMLICILAAILIIISIIESIEDGKKRYELYKKYMEDTGKVPIITKKKNAGKKKNKHK